jgi:hypothetical protein
MTSLLFEVLGEASEEYNELIELLISIEFGKDGRCPSCGLHKSYGHEYDCELRDAIDKLTDPRTEEERGRDEDYTDLKNTQRSLLP